MEPAAEVGETCEVEEMGRSKAPPPPRNSPSLFPLGECDDACYRFGSYGRQGRSKTKRESGHSRGSDALEG